jgi:ribosomal protein S18 acetylase RimI-like enzyme
MKVESLGYRTDLFFPRFDGEIIDRTEYLVVKTPRNPTFYWGNFLLFPAPPAEGDLERWQDLFRKEIGVPPQVRHQSFGIDGVDGLAGEWRPFQEAGFRLDLAVVLTSKSLFSPMKYCDEVEVRPLKQDWEWQAALDNHVLSRSEDQEEVAYRVFSSRQLDRYRAMASAGCGAWYGAFINDQLVADLGIYVCDGVARFQSVGTHPEYRRRGICGTLVFESSKKAQTQFAINEFVIVAEAGSHAAGIYERLGFEMREQQIAFTLSGE